MDESRRIQTAIRASVSQRNYRRARDRALTQLANKYREEYLLLYSQEKERDQKEGKVWTDLSSSLIDQPNRSSQALSSSNTSSS